MDSITLPRVFTVNSAPANSKCIWKWCSVSVQHHLRFFHYHISCIKMAALKFYVQPGRYRKLGLVEDDSHIIFGQKFSGEKGSVRWCVVVMQQSVLLSPKFGAKSSHIFPQFP
jgi:hypothetical protein